jgi:hypothetical protein
MGSASAQRRGQRQDPPGGRLDQQVTQFVDPMTQVDAIGVVSWSQGHRGDFDGPTTSRRADDGTSADALDVGASVEWPRSTGRS